MEPKWLVWAREMQAMAQTDLTFSARAQKAAAQSAKKLIWKMLIWKWSPRYAGFSLNQNEKYPKMSRVLMDSQRPLTLASAMSPNMATSWSRTRRAGSFS
jgi:hypothetical protein